MVFGYSINCVTHLTSLRDFCNILQLSQVNILYMVMMMPWASDRGSQPFLWLEERSAYLRHAFRYATFRLFPSVAYLKARREW